MLRLALSVVTLLCIAVVHADAQTLAPTGTRPCAFEGESIRHRGAKYFVGRPHRRGSIYGACEDGVLTCFEDNGIADAPQSKHATVSCNAQHVRARRRQLGVAVHLREDVWPNNVIWYRINASFSASERQTIHTAIDVYEHSDVNISFRECEPATLCSNKYVSFEQNEDACYSFVGYVDDGKPQIVNLGESCFDGTGTAVHEIGHALGLYHEHTHPERQVIVLTDENLPVSPANYAKETDAIFKAYDRGSIMHYGRKGGLCFPKDDFALATFCDVEVTTNCTMPLRSHCNATRTKEIGQRSVLSVGDLNTLKTLYGATNGSSATESQAVVIPNGSGSGSGSDSDSDATSDTSASTASSGSSNSNSSTNDVSTLAPSTALPTTQSPAPESMTLRPTQEPIDEDGGDAPVETKAPATEAPTEAPTTEEPMTKAPTEETLTEEPATEEPVTKAPTSPSAAPATSTRSPYAPFAPIAPSSSSSTPYAPGDVHGGGSETNNRWWPLEWLKWLQNEHMNWNKQVPDSITNEATGNSNNQQQHKRKQKTQRNGRYNYKIASHDSFMTANDSDDNSDNNSRLSLRGAQP